MNKKKNHITLNDDNREIPVMASMENDNPSDRLMLQCEL